LTQIRGQKAAQAAKKVSSLTNCSWRGDDFPGRKKAVEQIPQLIGPHQGSVGIPDGMTE